MSKTIEFFHGALSDPYEEQANRQGYTLGDKRYMLEQLGESLTYCWIQDVLTDSQYDAALKKLQRQLTKALKPIQNTNIQED